MKNLLLTFLFLLSPFQVWACISAPVLAEEVARDDVSVGYVTGDEYPDYEATLIKEGAAQYPLLGRHIVRVAFTEALKGPLLGPTTLETSCYDTKPSSGDRVVVFRYSGYDYVRLATPEYESAIRAAIARQHER